MNGLTGPVLVTPTRLFSQPHWKTAVITPNAAAADSRFITAAVAGIARLRNTIISSRKDSTTTMPTNSGSLDDSWPGHVDADGGCAADQDLQVLPVQRGRDNGAAQVADQVDGGLVLRAARRVDLGHRDRGMARPGREELRPVAATTPGVWLAALTTVPKAALSAGPGSGGHQLERAAEAGPEPVHEHLVAPVGGGRGAGRVDAVVGGALPHRQVRDAERDHDAEGGDAEHEPVALHEGRPAGPAAGRLVEVGLAPGQGAALPAGQQPLSGQAEHAPAAASAPRATGNATAIAAAIAAPDRVADADSEDAEQRDADGDARE